MPAIPRKQEISLVPIGEIKVVRGERAGPALVASTGRKDWVLAYWDGSLWHDLDGFPLTPAVLAWLPSLHQILADLGAYTP
jgi:hypothetical protein